MHFTTRYPNLFCLCKGLGGRCLQWHYPILVVVCGANKQVANENFWERHYVVWSTPWHAPDTLGQRLLQGFSIHLAYSIWARIHCIAFSYSARICQILPVLLWCGGSLYISFLKLRQPSEHTILHISHKIQSSKAGGGKYTLGILAIICYNNKFRKCTVCCLKKLSRQETPNSVWVDSYEQRSRQVLVATTCVTFLKAVRFLKRRQP